MKINDGFLAQMREATQLLQTEGPMAATAAIQRALHGTGAQSAPSAQADWAKFMPQALKDINPLPAGETAAHPSRDEGERARFGKITRGAWRGASAHQPVQDVESIDLAGKGRYLARSCTSHAGMRAYKLYVPSSYAGEPLPLIVMLHGCTQNPDDFAAGTGMNAVAEDNHCFVAYPAQTTSANGSNCWNWFKPGDQQRGHGEPAIIADITREIMREYKIDASRVYVAGLSAGGAMATVMGAMYPDLYAAIGIHSGLPYAVAHDVPSAFAAMKRRAGKSAAHKIAAPSPAPLGHVMPVIVFHGDRDTTVHASNGDQALSQCVPDITTASSKESGVCAKVEKGTVPNGRAYTKTAFHDRRGKVIAEKWTIHGAGHAWSGGSSKGSYTDPQGPDAAREMLRFFYAHRRNAD